MTVRGVNCLCESFNLKIPPRCKLSLTDFFNCFAVILVLSSVATAAGAWGLITDNQHVGLTL